MSTETDTALERVTLGKVALRLLPLMFLLYIFNILDRVNIGIAILTMQKDLGFSDAAYGFGAGVFFCGYFIFEVPSNVILERGGARRWIARITMTWGIVAACMLFVRTPLHFYILRFLLGLAEAGFFPGMVLYLTYWFPDVVRGRATARFIIANTCASIIGGPLGALILKLDGVAGLHGWQWLFLVEGIPSFLMGFVVLAFMTDRPAAAKWLLPAERDWLVRRLAAEQEHRQRFHHMGLVQAFAYPRVLHLAALFFLNILAGSGLGFFANKLLKERSGWNDQEVLLLNAIPPIIGAGCLLLSATYSDRTGERRLFVGFGLAVAVCGMLLAATTRSPVVTLAAFCVISMGTSIANAPFWALTSGFLSGAAAAGGIAFINSVGNSGSFFGPWFTGYLREATKSYQVPLYVMAGLFSLASLVAFLLPADPAQQAPVSPAESEPA